MKCTVHFAFFRPIRSLAAPSTLTHTEWWLCSSSGRHQASSSSAVSIMAMHSECSLRAEHCLSLSLTVYVATVRIELHPMRLDSGQLNRTVVATAEAALAAVSDADYGALKMPDDGGKHCGCCYSCDGQRAIGLRPNNKKDRRRWRCDSRRRWALSTVLAIKESKVKASSFLAFLRLAKSEKHIITGAPLHWRQQRKNEDHYKTGKIRAVFPPLHFCRLLDW